MERSAKLVGLVLSALVAAGAVGGWASRSVARDVYESRVTAVETRQDEVSKRLERMERKLDRIFERVK
jgi:hypothetical protein